MTPVTGPGGTGAEHGLNGGQRAFRRESDAHRRAFAGGAVDIKRSAVQVHQRIDQGQPQPGTIAGAADVGLPLRSLVFWARIF